MIAIVVFALGIALVTVFAIAATRVATSSAAWPTGDPFIAWSEAGRPRGVQEEDLPRFVFRDQPWAPPASAPTPTGLTFRPAAGAVAG